VTTDFASGRARRDITVRTDDTPTWV